MSITTLRKSSEINVGDVIQTYGMRVLLESAFDQRVSNGSMTYAYKGKVLNLEEVLSEEGFIPPSFLERTEWVEGKGWTVVQRDYWVIQGNDLAVWAVENHHFTASYKKGNTGSTVYCGVCDQTRDAGNHF